MAHSRASVAGTHPLFGPSVHSLQGQRVILCRGRGEGWEVWLRDMFRALESMREPGSLVDLGYRWRRERYS